MQHFMKDAEEVATRGRQIAADYGFLSDRKESREESESNGLTPILIMRDRGSGATLSMAVPIPECNPRNRPRAEYKGMVEGSCE
eukprot:11429603-Heterocapsa_arctica.AAC.1